MNPTRRQILARSGPLLLGTAGWTALGRAATASPRKQETAARPALVTIYLRGGVDCLGVLVPYKEKRYAELRPTIAVAPPGERDGKPALPLDDTFALNPNMPELHALYREGRCVPAVCVGSHHATRSHFDAQDFMERAAPGMRHVREGWLNRYLSSTRGDRDPPLRALALQTRLPRSLRGSYPVLAVPGTETDGKTVGDFADLYKTPVPGENHAIRTPGDAMRDRIRRSGHDTIAQLRQLELIAADSAGTSYPDSPFGRQMRQVAAILKADCGLEIAALDYNGWDHHVDEGPVEGNMARHLANVSAAIGAFTRDLGPRMNRVLVLVMSEFGRTVGENGNAGTDHGHGGLMLAVGGRLDGKRVCGKWTGLEAGQLYEERDLPVHTDFRNVFAETLHRLFGFDGIKAGLFPEYTPASPPLEFLLPT